MATENEHLRATLEELRTQLLDSQLAPETRERLAALVEEIERSLAAAEGAADKPTKHETLLDRLTHATQEFEESHPTLANAIGSVADALSRIGI